MGPELRSIRDWPRKPGIRSHMPGIRFPRGPTKELGRGALGRGVVYGNGGSEEEQLSQGGAPRSGGRIPAAESGRISLEISGSTSKSEATKRIAIGGRIVTASSKGSTQEPRSLASRAGWWIQRSKREGVWIE